MTGKVPLPDDGTASRVARRAVRDALAEVAFDDPVQEEFVDDAELVTGELVSNAMSHGQPPFAVEFETGPGSVRVTVTNHGARGEPHVENASLTSGRGRGLAMVAHLADDWGWTRDGDRVDVWAVVSAG